MGIIPVSTNETTSKSAMMMMMKPSTLILLTITITITISLVTMTTAADEQQHLASNNPTTEETVLGAGTSSTLKTTRADIDALCEALKKKKTLKADTPMYHWTDFRHCLRWSSTGGIDEGEMNYFTHHERDAQLSKAGAGIYIASSKTSSKIFGYCAVEFTIPAGTPYYDAALATKLVGKGKALTLRWKTEVGKVCPFIDYYSASWGSGQNDWHVAHHHSLFKRARVEWDVTMQRLHGAALYQFFEELRLMPQELQGKVDKRTHDLWSHAAGYTYSLYTLMYYYDPISMLRAVNVMPDDPWQAFEPKGFGPYMEARSKMFKHILLEKGHLGITAEQSRSFAAEEYKHQKFGGGSGSACEKWATRMVDEVLADTYKNMSGTSIEYRECHIHAGGDEMPDKSFDAVGEWVDTMNANKMLELHCRPNTVRNKGYLCYYYYPSADHCPGVESWLSGDLKKQVTAKPVRASPEYRKATKSMMRELLIKVFRELCGKPLLPISGVYKSWPPTGTQSPAYYQSGQSASSYYGLLQVMVDMISVHPCTDFNGRSTRSFASFAALEAGIPVPVMLLYDMDIQLPPKKLSEFVERTTWAYTSIQRHLITVMMKQIEAGVKVDLRHGYLDIHDGWMNLLDPLKVLGCKPPAKWSNDVQRLIEKRRWTELFDAWTDNGWTATTQAKCREAKFNDAAKQPTPYNEAKCAERSVFF